jgi:LPXTG-motif cell wall-anchored protein
MAALPQTGGGAFPPQAVMVGLGGLAVAGGLGLQRLRRRSR